MHQKDASTVPNIDAVEGKGHGVAAPQFMIGQKGGQERNLRGQSIDGAANATAGPALHKLQGRIGTI